MTTPEKIQKKENKLNKKQKIKNKIKVKKTGKKTSVYVFASTIKVLVSSERRFSFWGF